MKTVARDIMKPIRLAVSPATTLTEVRDLLIQHHYSGAPVIDENGDLVGVISQTDLIRAVVGDFLGPDSEDLLEVFGESGNFGDPLLGKTAGEVISHVIYSAEPNDPVGEVARKMLAHHIHRLIVVENNKPVGIISSMDLVTLLAD